MVFRSYNTSKASVSVVLQATKMEMAVGPPRTICRRGAPFCSVMGKVAMAVVVNLRERRKMRWKGGECEYTERKVGETTTDLRWYRRDLTISNGWEGLLWTSIRVSML